MSKQQIPVVVLAGFLGSGKTTLLNQLLWHSRGTRIGAVVNDFGSIEIDAMTVAGQVGSTVSLGNGCLCCAVDASELDTYLELLTRPSAGLDVIVIEASGLAEPQELVRMILASENPNIVYGGLVEVVDAAEFDATRQRHPELDRHLGIADLIVLNKTDRVADGTRERLLALVRELGGGAAVTAATYGRIDPGLLFDRKPKAERYGQLSFDDVHEDPEGEAAEGDASHHGHLHTAYDSVDFTTDVPIHPRRLMDFLDVRPDGLYRIKGFVDFGALDTRNKYALHAVGRFLRFYPQPWEPQEERLTQLVLIGSGVDGGALRKELDHCQDTEGQGRDRVEAPVDDSAMWGVLRYVRGETAEAPRGPSADQPLGGERLDEEPLDEELQAAGPVDGPTQGRPMP